MTVLTQRYSQAVEYARIAHAPQFRKGTTIPYVYHLLGVSSIVLEYGGNEDQAIGGLLHDVLEDCGGAHEVTIRAQFGEAVAKIVKDCTDSSSETKANLATVEARRANWRDRKLAYIASLETKSLDSLLVSASDKLHNARAIVTDAHGKTGLEVFERFKAGREGTLKYYESLARVLVQRAAEGSERFQELAQEFDRTVAAMHDAAEAAREPLA
jgi:(p)ppGpp synthase/HD superfamily hydrolase